MQSKHRQRGMGLFKLVFVFGAIAIVATIGIKCFPLYGNQLKLARAVSGVASEGSIDPVQVRNALQRRWDIEDITMIQPKDIVIERGDHGVGALTYEYEARTHLFYNADLVLTFSGREPIAQNNP